MPKYPTVTHTIEVRAFIDVKVMPGANGEPELQEIVDICLYSEKKPGHMVIGINSVDGVCARLEQGHGDKLMQILAVQLSEIPR